MFVTMTTEAKTMVGKFTKDLLYNNHAILKTHITGIRNAAEIWRITTPNVSSILLTNLFSRTHLPTLIVTSYAELSRQILYI